MLLLSDEERRDHCLNRLYHRLVNLRTSESVRKRTIKRVKLRRRNNRICRRISRRLFPFGVQKRYEKRQLADGQQVVVAVPTEGEIDEDMLTSSVCRASFYKFVQEFWHVISDEEPVWNWHIEYLCNEMQKLAEGVFRRDVRPYDLVVNISPGTTKSTVMSIMFPAWVWTRMPNAQIIGASHTEDLAKELSMKSRDVVMSDRYMALFPEIQIRGDMNTKTMFKNTANGFRYAVGTNGSAIGKHFHFIIIDDPIDPKGTKSAIELKDINEFVTETLISRKVNKAVCVSFLVMQRLHEDDATAAMLKRKKIKHIMIPADLSDGPPVPEELKKKYTKQTGADGKPVYVMDPVRLAEDQLQEYREVGEFYYASQFLQKPRGKSGNMFKTDRLKFGVPPDVFMSVVRYWDKAGTVDGGTYTVGTKIGKDMSGGFWVLDVQRFQMDSFEREKRIRQITELDGRAVKVVVEQEPGSGGKESAQATVRNLAGFTVEIDKVSASRGDKERRADPWSSQVNAGNVYLPERAAWSDAWISEHTYFPQSRFKDQVDSAAGAFAFSHKKKRRAGALGGGSKTEIFT